MVTRNSSLPHQPMLQAVQRLDGVKELIRSDKRETFITMLNFFDDQDRIAFCKCLDKVAKHHLQETSNYVWNLGLSMVARKGHRAMMYSQTIANLLVPEFYGGKEVQSNRNKDKPAAPNV